MVTRFVIVHPKWGIYLGHCLGLGFFSKLDPVGQPEATTFKDVGDAIEHIYSWQENNDPNKYLFKPVDIAGAIFATIPELKKAGLKRHLGDMEKDALLYGDHRWETHESS